MIPNVSKVSIIGAGHTRFGRLSQNLEELITEATQEALADAGVAAADVDAIFVGHFNSGLVSDGFPSSLVHQADPGFRFTPAARMENACASGSAAIFAGLNAILSGQAETVLVVGVEKMTSRSTAEVTTALAGAGYQNDEFEASLSFPDVFALAARTYAERYGDPLPAMAKIASKNHMNAMKNPLAQMHRPMTPEQANTVTEKNPVISAPLRLSDCSLISDGAAAIVLTTTERAKDFPRAVQFKAAVHVSDSLPMTGRDVISFEGPARAISKAYEQAGVTVGDLSFAEVHDCFTIAELLIYEAMGLAEKGKGAEAIDSGRVLAEGSLPVNLSGGLKAKGHPVGATGVSMHALSYRQLTGQAGEMQLADPQNALIFNMGGAAVANYATILSRRD